MCLQRHLSHSDILLILQFLLDLFLRCSVVVVCHWFWESYLCLRQPSSVWLTPLLYCNMLVLNTGHDVSSVLAIVGETSGLFLLKCADTQTPKQGRTEGSIQEQAGKLRQQQ